MSLPTDQDVLKLGYVDQNTGLPCVPLTGNTSTSDSLLLGYVDQNVGSPFIPVPNGNVVSLLLNYSQSSISNLVKKIEKSESVSQSSNMVLIKIWKGLKGTSQNCSSSLFKAISALKVSSQNSGITLSKVWESAALIFIQASSEGLGKASLLYKVFTQNSSVQLGPKMISLTHGFTQISSPFRRGKLLIISAFHFLHAAASSNKKKDIKDRTVFPQSSSTFPLKKKLSAAKGFIQSSLANFINTFISAVTIGLTATVYKCSDGRKVIVDNNFTATFVNGKWEKGILVTGDDLSANFTVVTNKTEILLTLLSARPQNDQFDVTYNTTPLPYKQPDLTAKVWSTDIFDQVLIIDGSTVYSKIQNTWYRGNAIDGTQLGVTLLPVLDTAKTSSLITEARQFLDTPQRNYIHD